MAPLPALFSLTALKDTLLKKQPLPGDKLPDDAKRSIRKGLSITVSGSYEVPRDSHCCITLAESGACWFLYGPHWRREQRQIPAEASPSTSLIRWGDFDCPVTRHLSVGEVLQWDRRRQPAPGSLAVSRIIQTANHFQQIRNAWGSSLGVTSFYRPEPINSLVGGVRGSRHTTGEAMDLYPVGRSIDAFYAWIASRWSGGLGDGRHRGFLHLDTRDGGGFHAAGGSRPAVIWTY
jgi:hypothetical protein